MRNFEDDDIDSEESQDLKQEELIAMNRHFKNRRSNRNSKMTSQMESLYKQALMDTFFGRFEEASKKLKSHIALCPDHSQSYHLLGTMYEQLGQDRNAVEYFFMSAYLSAPNFEKWKKVGQMSFQLKMYNQAAYCFGRALKIQNYNIQLMSRRAEAFDLSHQSKKAISTYKKILSIAFSLPILKKYAKLRFKRDEFKTARDILMEYKDHQNDAQTAYMICQTYLKQEKYENLLQYLTGFVHNKKQEDSQFGIESLNIEFLILLYVCLIKLNKQNYDQLNANTNQLKKLLINEYDQSYSTAYQLLLTYTKTNEQVLKQILSFLIKFKSHKTIQNYLLYSQFLKKDNKFDIAIQSLKQGLQIHKNSVQLTSQLNHIKVISGNWKQTKRGQLLDFKKNIKNQTQNIDDIFYSDEQADQLIQQEVIKQDIPTQAIKSKKRNLPKSNKPSQTKNNQNKSLQTQDPQIIKRLLYNCNQTLSSIVNYYDQLSTNVISRFRQVQDCVNFIINLTASQKSQDQQQKQGLFNRNYRRRRYFTSKQSNRQNLINNNLPKIIQILQNVMLFMKIILKQKHFNKVKHLAQILSKAYFFRWQNKSVQLKKIKKQLYQMGLLACLSLQKYETGVFFIKYLAHKQPDNSFYLLIVNYLIHNSNTKICMSSLLGKYANRANLLNNNKESKISQNKYKNDEQNFFQDDQDSQNLSYPRKMSNISNFSDIIRNNVKLNYLFGIQYMETGCFDLAISSFLKIINGCQGQLKKTIWLCLSSCFIQISSSRTCHSKLPHTNCSTYCLWQYLNQCEDEIEKMYNKGRFLAQIRMNAKAIQILNNLLEKQVTTKQQQGIQLKGAYCLLCIYKDVQSWEMVNKISQKYFNIESQIQCQQKQQKNNDSQFFVDEQSNQIELEQFQ